MIPSVVGRPLQEAKNQLERAGFKVLAILETRSPRGGPTGPIRVVRQQEIAEGVVLTTAASVPLLGNDKINKRESN